MFMAVHLLKKTKYLAHQVGFESWQCAFPRGTFRQVVCAQKTNTNVGTCTVLVWFWITLRHT
jgi:hypothetical protein